MIGDAAAEIDHVEQHLVAPLPGGHDGLTTRRRVCDRVGEQVGEHPLEQARVGPDERQLVGHHQPYVAGALGLVPGQRRDLVNRGGPQERLKRAGREPAHIEQVADQVVEPIGGLLRGSQQSRLVFGRELHPGLAQRADARLDRG